MIESNGSLWSGQYDVNGRVSRVHETQSSTLVRPYVAQGLPVEVHIHGIGDIDFSADCRSLNMERLQNLFEQEGVMGIPTVFLDYALLQDFSDLLKRFSEQKSEGRLQNILGFALEGPLLLSQGGTPEEGSWKPSMREWQTIAECGEYGLRYVVISPDLDDTEELKAIISLLLSHGVKPAIGHCRQDASDASVRGIEVMVEQAKLLGFQPGNEAILTDHLFNDMPRLFKHAWRTLDERRMRSRELIAQHLGEWSFDRLDEQVGPVPATLMRYAREGMIALFLNFDGEHVDTQVAKRAYELVGAEHIMAMTDRVEQERLGRRSLTKGPVGTLWYQEEGVVAAGSSNIDDQIRNMRSCGIPEQDIWKMCSLTAGRVFGISPAFTTSSYISVEGGRIAIPS